VVPGRRIEKGNVVAFGERGGPGIEIPG